jgi:hypothetical protein
VDKSVPQSAKEHTKNTESVGNTRMDTCVLEQFVLVFGDGRNSVDSGKREQDGEKEHNGNISE